MFPIVLCSIVFSLFFIVVWLVSNQLNSSDTLMKEEEKNQKKEKEASP